MLQQINDFHVAVLRGMARELLSQGRDEGEVAFALARKARIDGMNDVSLGKAFDDLKQEGYFAE